MIDMSKCSFEPLGKEEQKEFERRAIIMDDSNEPPVNNTGTSNTSSSNEFKR